MTELRIGSLCSGYDGLAMGLQAVVGGRVVWQSENDKHASKILEARYPGVPNLGDLTTVDWTSVEQVDWMCAGYPCQPFSHAGQRKGTADERHIWPYVAAAIRAVRPSRVLLENVAGHLTMGFDVVLADLAAMGFDATWGVVRAADAGAPHGRARLFVVAADTSRGSLAWSAAAGNGLRLPTEGPHRPDCPPVADTTSSFIEDESSCRNDGVSPISPIPGTSDRDSAGDHASGDRHVGRGTDLVATAWGNYEPAIRRWERVTGRTAPRPTLHGPTGERLSPHFVEWMMGLPVGWVTSVDIPRNAQLTALGNGCVPQQVALAVSALLDLERVAA